MKLGVKNLGLFSLWLVFLEVTLANKYAKQLHEDLLRKKGYNSFVRPVKNSSDVIVVKIGIRLTQIIDVDEQNQMMTTNLWVVQEWTDTSLQWDPEDYDNVTEIYVPAETIWNPEIVLFNNADGNYMLTVASKAKLSYDGYVKWHPPASIKTSCTINVKYFPFDVQTCTLQFGSWTYSTEEVVLVHKFPDLHNPDRVVPGIDFKEFYSSVEWDIMDAWATRTAIHLAGSIETFQEWTFAIVLRRKFLFYITNLIIPLVAHAFVTILVFYLPSESREKISLCINILLSLTVYFLMLAEVIPPTSIVVPLMAEYLLFTLILVTSSIIITTLTLNIHFRTAASHVMPDWVRKIFLYFLPRILRMKRPKVENSQDIELKHIKLNLCTCLDGENIRRNDSAFKYQFGSKRTKTQVELYKLSKALDDETYFRKNLDQQYSAEVADAIEGAIFIANHLKQEDEFKRTKEDWKYVAQVVDRIFLIIYSFICIAGTMAIILKAPSLYDKSKMLKLHPETPVSV